MADQVSRVEGLPPTYSLRRRLIATTVGSSVIVGLVSTIIVLALAWRETSEAFDDTLEEGARLVLALGEEAARDGAVRRSRIERGPSMRFDYQLISSAGAVLRRGEDAPERPFVDPASRDDRFYDTRVDGQWWRVYVVRHDDLDFSVQIGQEWDERIDLIVDVLESLAWPLVTLWLLLGLVNWWLVRRLLKPLDRLSRSLVAKSPEDLAPLPADDRAAEIRSVASALNLLLARLSRALEGERRFTADAAHELRTPLAALASRIQLMQRSHQNRAVPALAADLQRLRDDVARSTALVENLLQLARLDPQSSDAVKMTAVDLPDLLAEVVRTCQPMALAHGVEILVDCRLQTLVGHRAWLFSALRNLVENGIRHGRRPTAPEDGEGSPGGRVVIAALNGTEGPEFAISDDGPGVADADQARLGQRFFRVLGGMAQGSGLGLSIVARVAELHRARLAFGPGLDGRGLGVTLSFPGR